MNWKFWKKSKSSCLGYYGASVMPQNAYVDKSNCSDCKEMWECFFKSQKPIRVRLGVGTNLEEYK
jgi:hypothetical protein